MPNDRPVISIQLNPGTVRIEVYPTELVIKYDGRELDCIADQNNLRQFYEWANAKWLASAKEKL